jgi:hypothetical protein
MKVIRIALSIPLMALAGVAGVAGFLSLVLATALSMLADRVYGGGLSHDVMDLSLRSNVKHIDAEYEPDQSSINHA